MASNLVNGIKEKLLSEFREMYPIHGVKWRKKIKAVNPWHATEHALYAWDNLRSKGNCGSEPMRVIVADMKKVLENDERGHVVPEISERKLKAIRATAIKNSLRNLSGTKAKTKKQA